MLQNQTFCPTCFQGSDLLRHTLTNDRLHCFYCAQASHDSEAETSAGLHWVSYAATPSSRVFRHPRVVSGLLPCRNHFGIGMYRLSWQQGGQLTCHGQPKAPWLRQCYFVTATPLRHSFRFAASRQSWPLRAKRQASVNLSSLQNVKTLPPPEKSGILEPETFQSRLSPSR